MVYLSVEKGCKAHRLYDPSRNKLQVSTNVIFQENPEWTWKEGVNDDKKIPEFSIMDVFYSDRANLKTNGETGSENVTPPAAVEIPTGGEASPSTNSPNTHEATSPQVTNTPVRLRSITNIYANTEEVLGVEEEENEVMMMVSEEPTCYQEVAIKAHCGEGPIKVFREIERGLQVDNKVMEWSISNGSSLQEVTVEVAAHFGGDFNTVKSDS
ncbi:hypothetical protein V6N13_116218 [Hibiscus sabdariffa]